MHYILLDAATVNHLIKKDNNRVICTINHAVSFHCAIMPKKEGGHFINIGQAVCKKLGLTEGCSLEASFETDNTPYQFDMPEELMEVLNTDSKAYDLFHNLTEGNQRGLIYLITQVKSQDKRIARALKIAQQLKNGITSPRTILK